MGDKYPPMNKIFEIYIPIIGLGFILYCIGMLFFLSTYITFESRKSERQ
jgi:hypothetical protein